MHTELLGLSKPLLRKIAPLATHQHRKGGLYRVTGMRINTVTKERFLQYRHVFPHPEADYEKPEDEFRQKFTNLLHKEEE